jgi:hypothetical protein
MKQFNTLCGKHSEFFNIKQVVGLYIVTIMLPRVKICCVGFQTIPMPVPAVSQFMLDGMAKFKS